MTAKTSLRNKLFLYVQNLQRVEIFHTPGARLGYTLMFYLQETTDLSIITLYLPRPPGACKIMHFVSDREEKLILWL